MTITISETMILSNLLVLQKEDINIYLLLQQGLLDELFLEAKTVQIRHPKQKKCEVNEKGKQFDKVMSTGKISAVISCLSDKKTKGALPLN